MIAAFAIALHAFAPADARDYAGPLAAEPSPATAPAEPSGPATAQPPPPPPDRAQPQPQPTATATAPPSPRSLRIPSVATDAVHVQPWVKSTMFAEWYRQNHNTLQSDDGFVGLVGRLGVGSDARMRRVSLGAQLRLDGQAIWFPAGQDCTGDCVPVDDDVRLERVTVRADTRHVSAQAGDTNASFGRGMGLSVRKIDLIGVDATVKGGRFDVVTRPVRVTAIGGFANRQNSDFATRQLVEDPGHPAQSYTFAPDVGDGVCRRDDAIGDALWTVCSDLVAGGRVQATLPGKVDVGTHWVHVDFGDELSTGVDEYAHLVGADVGRMRIAKVWDAFVGGGAIVRNPNLFGTPLAPQSFTGHGLYASNVFSVRTTTLLVEAKHYRDYSLALTSSSLVQYVENPTLEREDQQVPGNANATGARVRLDHRIAPLGLTLFGNTLAYTYAEGVGPSALGPADARLATHNFAGVIWRRPGRDFVLQLSGGYRHERLVSGTPSLRRRFPHAEVYVSIPLARRDGLTHALSLGAEGRFENARTIGAGEDFLRGLLTLGYSVSPWFSLTFLQAIDTEQPTPAGEPSLTRERCRAEAGSTCRPHLWPGAQAQVNVHDASFIRVFAGRQVGGRVCVNGSCRTLPDFEGVRAEVVFSF